jgi:hypothetical protein
MAIRGLVSFYIAFILNFSEFKSMDAIKFILKLRCIVCGLWKCLEQVRGSEFAAGGFVLGVCRYRVIFSRRN